MGLYQYIREQEYRDDVVGQLGRWLKRHPGKRPEEGLAFDLASNEYAACGEWTRKGAVNRLNNNEPFHRMTKIDRRIVGVVSEAIKIRASKDYRRARAYSTLKAKITELVGWGAKEEELRTPFYYDVMINIINDVLPPDSGDLYPDGPPDGVTLDL